MIIKDNKTELYHSATYLGKDYSDGIKHWKYTKKERRNGRWVYYYDDSSLRKAEKNYDKALNNATKKTINDMATASEYRNKIKENREAISKTSDPRVADQLQRQYDTYLKPQYDYYSKGGNKTENKKLDDTIRKTSSKLRSERIMNATLGILAKGTIHGLNAISYGKQKVGKALSKLGKLFKR